MKYLTFMGAPRMEEAAKDVDQRTSLYGAAVAKTEIVRALLLHGSYDRYFFVCDSIHALGGAQQVLNSYPNREKAEAILVDDYSRLRANDHMILFAGDAAISEMARLRMAQGRATWPITGITHALSHGRGVPMALGSLFAGLQGYDCLICTSRAGKRAVEAVIAEMREHVRQQAGAAPPWRVQLPVIPLGVDASLYAPRDRQEARRRLGIAPHPTVFLYVGRFSAASKMDPFPLILTFRQSLASQIEDVLLVLAGDDTVYHMAAQITQSAADLGIADKVRVMPNITHEEKLSLYAAADVFVSPSDNVQETFGLTLIEAMACGLPVLASDWDGYRDSVVQGETGFLVPTRLADCTDHVSRLTLLKGDPAIHWLLGQAVSVDVAELGRRMRLLYEDPHLRAEMGEAGRRRVLETYDWPRIVGRYEELWAELVSQARRQAGDPTAKDKVFAPDYFKIFKHYATAALTGEARLRITPLGRMFVEGGLRIRPLMTDEAPFKAKLSLQIAAEYVSGEARSVAELIERLGARTGVTAEILFHHAARLVKYGVLEIYAGGRERPKPP